MDRQVDGIDLSSIRLGCFIIYDGHDYILEQIDHEMVHLRSQVDGSITLVSIAEAENMYEAFFSMEDREK